nr:hypothetical protein [Tanacetum cinerariifolium]
VHSVHHQQYHQREADAEQADGGEELAPQQDLPGNFEVREQHGSSAKRCFALV